MYFFFFFKVRSIYTLPTLASENIRFVSEQVFKAAEGRLDGWPAGEGGGCEDPAGRSLLGAGGGSFQIPSSPQRRPIQLLPILIQESRVFPPPGSLMRVQLGHRRRPPTAHILSRALGVPPSRPQPLPQQRPHPLILSQRQSWAGFAEPLGALHVPSLCGDMKESERGQSSRLTRICGGTTDVPCLTHTRAHTLLCFSKCTVPRPPVACTAQPPSTAVRLLVRACPGPETALGAEATAPMVSKSPCSHRGFPPLKETQSKPRSRSRNHTSAGGVHTATSPEASR